MNENEVEGFHHFSVQVNENEILEERLGGAGSGGTPIGFPSPSGFPRSPSSLKISDAGPLPPDLDEYNFAPPPSPLAAFPRRATPPSPHAKLSSRPLPSPRATHFPNGSEPQILTTSTGAGQHSPSSSMTMTDSLHLNKQQKMNAVEVLVPTTSYKEPAYPTAKGVVARGGKTAKKTPSPRTAAPRRVLGSFGVYTLDSEHNPTCIPLLNAQSPSTANVWARDKHRAAVGEKKNVSLGFGSSSQTGREDRLSLSPKSASLLQTALRGKGLPGGIDDLVQHTLSSSTNGTDAPGAKRRRPQNAGRAPSSRHILARNSAMKGEPDTSLLQRFINMKRICGEYEQVCVGMNKLVVDRWTSSREVWTPTSMSYVNER